MFWSIIVTYFPQIDQVNGMILELQATNLNVIIFDNTPDTNQRNYINNEKTYILGNGCNQGLSLAFNQSIDFALLKSDNTEGFLFFDQDSIIEKNKIMQLLSDYFFLIDKKYPVGVLGAYPYNPKNNLFYNVLPLHNQKIDLTDYITVEYVISSFSLVPLSTIKKIGKFDDKLFIDLVDSEYSYRCTKNDLYNIVSKKVAFSHTIGEKTGSIFGLRRFAISSPPRNYYQARNLILVGKDYGWHTYALIHVSKRFIQILLSAFYSGQLTLRLKYFSQGVFDGIKGVGGSYQNRKTKHK